MDDDAHHGAPWVAPETRARRFHVTGWMTGNGSGLLRVTPAVLTFEPNWWTRYVLRLSGPLVHRRRKVVLVSNPLNLGGFTIVLRADAPEDMPTSSPLLGGSSSIAFANIHVYPWQRWRVRSAMRDAGFDLDLRRRWFLPFWRPID